MSGELHRTASQWRAAGRAAVVVEVAGARGSVPRPAGTRMLVALDAVCGSVGGGQLELQAIAQARALLAAGGGAADRRMALGPSLGQCCGGALDLRFTPLAAADPAAWPVAAPRFALQLYGAGHVGRAVARLLEALPCEVQWIDEREHEFPAAAPAPHIERVCVDEVQGEVARAPAGAFYLVMTHSHAIDLAVVHAVLQRGDFGFLGVIGSRSKRASFEHRLVERGVPAQLLQRMACPIGLPGIAGKEPEVIAVAVVAQLLQCSAPPAPGIVAPHYDPPPLRA